MMSSHNLHDRTPSPGQPLTGYQLSDNPYMQDHLVMPSSDRLAEQPTVSCDLKFVLLHLPNPCVPNSTR